jgi:hypothetical protein
MIFYGNCHRGGHYLRSCGLEPHVQAGNPSRRSGLGRSRPPIPPLSAAQNAPAGLAHAGSVSGSGSANARKRIHGSRQAPGGPGELVRQAARAALRLEVAKLQARTSCVDLPAPSSPKQAIPPQGAQIEAADITRGSARRLLPQRRSTR